MASDTNNIRLAQLIRRALLDPELRFAIESGSVSASSQRVSTAEMGAVVEVMRGFKGKQVGGLTDLSPFSVLGHRDDD